MTYAYQWQRCDADGANCADIAGATASATRSPTTTRARPSASTSPTRNAGRRRHRHRAPDRRRRRRTRPSNIVAPSLSRHRPRRPDADASTPATGPARPPLDLRLPVAALRRRGRQLRRHRGAVALTYALATADVGTTLRVIVSATNARRHGPVTTAASDVVGRYAARVNDRPDRHRHGRRRRDRHRRPGIWSGTAPVRLPTSGCAATSTARTATRSPAPPTTSTRLRARTPTTASRSRSPPRTPRAPPPARRRSPPSTPPRRRTPRPRPSPAATSTATP